LSRNYNTGVARGVQTKTKIPSKVSPLSGLTLHGLYVNSALE